MEKSLDEYAKEHNIGARRGRRFRVNNGPNNKPSNPKRFGAGVQKRGPRAGGPLNSVCDCLFIYYAIIKICCKLNVYI